MPISCQQIPACIKPRTQHLDFKKIEIQLTLYSLQVLVLVRLIRSTEPLGMRTLQDIKVPSRSFRKKINSQGFNNICAFTKVCN